MTPFCLNIIIGKVESSEMKHFGVLPENYKWQGPPEEMWRIDRAYWQSLWYRPADE